MQSASAAAAHAAYAAYEYFLFMLTFSCRAIVAVVVGDYFASLFYDKYW